MIEDVDLRAGPWPVPRSVIKKLRASTINDIAEATLKDLAASLDGLDELNLHELLDQLNQGSLRFSRTYLCRFLLKAVGVLAPPSTAHMIFAGCLMELQKHMLYAMPDVMMCAGLGSSRHKSHRSNFLASIAGLFMARCRVWSGDLTGTVLEQLVLSVCNFNRTLGESQYEEQDDDTQGVGRNVLFTVAASLLAWTKGLFGLKAAAEGSAVEMVLNSKSVSAQVVYKGSEPLYDNLKELVGHFVLHVPRADLYEFAYLVNTVTPTDSVVSDLEISAKAAAEAVYVAVMLQAHKAYPVYLDWKAIQPFNQVLAPIAKLGAFMRPLYVLGCNADHPDEGLATLDAATAMSLVVFDQVPLQAACAELKSAHQTGFEIGAFVGLMCSVAVAWKLKADINESYRSTKIAAALAAILASLPSDPLDEVCFRALEVTLENGVFASDLAIRAQASAFMFKHWRKGLGLAPIPKGSERASKTQRALLKAAESIESPAKEWMLIMDIASTYEILKARGVPIMEGLKRALQRVSSSTETELALLLDAPENVVLDEHQSMMRITMDRLQTAMLPAESASD
eukprot:Blabericola_migrator_1__1285@NODE_1333_length_4779_cov_9_917869_g895_i0_p1_GENE_NODE_1333_length_4779_cov_9_917869_g895_i0NODE_1333_length_4779_cov_9_917869_g895_i0_p1_ORF_typecomplete_len668_score121_74_NODE_1333_length_4779_cov_9_917869_g895_i027754478